MGELLLSHLLQQEHRGSVKYLGARERRPSAPPCSLGGRGALSAKGGAQLDMSLRSSGVTKGLVSLFQNEKGLFVSLLLMVSSMCLERPELGCQDERLLLRWVP